MAYEKVGPFDFGPWVLFGESETEEQKLENKRQILRNCVNPELGLHIFESLTK